MFTIKLYREDIRYVHRARSYAATPVYVNITLPERNDQGKELFARFDVTGPNAFDRIEILNDSGVQVDLLVAPEPEQMQMPMQIDEPPAPPPLAPPKSRKNLKVIDQ